MKSFTQILFLAVLCALFTISACDDNGDPKTPDKKTENTNLLVNKGAWNASMVDVPDGTATESADWDGFSVTFTATSMTTSGHAPNSTVVWPSGEWSWKDDNANTIVRASDGIEMQVNELTASKLSVTFTMPDGTETTGRIHALDGEYTFVLE